MTCDSNAKAPPLTMTQQIVKIIYLPTKPVTRHKNGKIDDVTVDVIAIRERETRSENAVELSENNYCQTTTAQCLPEKV